MNNYCKPYNAGQASNASEIAKHLAKILNETECINSNLADGDLVSVLRELRYDMIEKLRKEGWTVRRNKQDNWVVLPSNKQYQ